MFRHHRCIAPAIALMLALFSATPAYARLELNPSAGAAPSSPPTSTNLCSTGCGTSGYTSPRTGAALPHDPRARSVALAGSGYGYGSTPIADSDASHPRSQVVSGGGYGYATAPRTLVHVAAPNNTFDWGDAGIGAASAIALMTLLVGGAFGAASLRRRGATRRTA